MQKRQTGENRRQCIVELTHEMLCYLMGGEKKDVRGFLDGKFMNDISLKVVAVIDNPIRCKVKILLEGDSLPQVAPGCEPPTKIIEYVDMSTYTPPDEWSKLDATKSGEYRDYKNPNIIGSTDRFGTTNRKDYPVTETYTGFSGVDMQCVIGSFTLDIQAISFTKTREMAPVYTMGGKKPCDYSRGKYGYAGTFFALADAPVNHGTDAVIYLRALTEDGIEATKIIQGVTLLDRVRKDENVKFSAKNITRWTTKEGLVVDEKSGEVGYA